MADIGKAPSGISIVAFHDEKLLLLREFRMSVNRTIFNLCAGMIEDGETIEECIRRELYEETGLTIKQIRTILPPSYAAVGISDTKTYIAIVDAEGEFSDHTSDNEMIQGAVLYKRRGGPNYWKQKSSVPVLRLLPIFLYRVLTDT